MEFELDDYRTGKIKQKRRNLSCVSEPGNYCNNKYNYNLNDSKKKENENINNKKIQTENNINNNIIEKPIYVNSNNNYLLTKLKKENENLRLRLSKYENNNNCNSNRFKPFENRIRQKKIENAVRITKKILNNKQLATKSTNNISNFANNTYTNNFYNSKENKYKVNNNSSIYNNFSNNLYGNNAMSTNSFVDHNKKNINNGMIKSLSVFRSTSKMKSKNKKKRIMFDRTKPNYKKINKLSNSNLSNFMEIKIKSKKDDDNIFTNLNINNLYNARMNTLNSDINSNNYFSWRKKTEESKFGQNFNSAGNMCNTDRKKTEVNASNSKGRISCGFTNNNNYKNEFNLTWSKFPKKSMEASFEHFRLGQGGVQGKIQKKNPEITLSSKIKKMNDMILNSNNKYLSNVNSKNKNLKKQIGNNNLDNNIKIRKDVTPQKITINRRMNNNKNKINKANNGSNNISMKNIINSAYPKNKKEENDKKNSLNNVYEGDIYVHKKRNSAYDIENKNIEKNHDMEPKKNNNMNNKYNVTINNINNCNYFSLIQASIRSELKIIRKKDK